MREFALFIIVTPQNTISGNNCVRQSIATFKKAVTTRNHSYSERSLSDLGLFHNGRYVGTVYC